MGEPTAAAGDRIVLTGLRVHGRHGVLPAERTDGQDFVIDAELEVDTAPAAAADALDLTVNYAELAGQLAAVVAGEPVDLIETLAARLADVCLGHAPVSAATITVHKPAAPIPLDFADVSVRIRRTAPVAPARSGFGFASSAPAGSAGSAGPGGAAS